MRRKALALLLSAMAVSMVGCGTKNTSEVQKEESVEVAEEKVESSSALDPNVEYVFGTATLSYAEFYSGDVSSTDSFDAVTSATTGKSEIFPNQETDFVDETTNADGYHITGVKNVNVAVPADQVEEYAKLNESFVKNEGEEPKQFKVVSIEDGVATYSATNFEVADTVTDADAQLETGVFWGDYQLDVIETSTSYIKNTREDGDFKIDGNIQGIILETKSGLKVGMEHLQSIWVQPYEIAFNISADNSHNPRMVFDNLPELDKLEKEEIVSVTFINQNDSYVYTFDGVYVKPVYKDAKVTGKVDESSNSMALENVPTDLGNPKVTVTYTVGEGREAVRTVVYEGDYADKVEFDKDAFSEAKAAGEGTYSAAVSSDNYADLSVEVK
ncbi:hypothetical protein SAMN02910298_00874 [Pseudobutyrivibrio sp. YE44]|uniref:hypothetical protein n=1 Tax=Pseudobutyrivibrio sp. YE44 TaxID=1520802 RepID=UPI00088C80F1|nr:hypothetical protein [Pseudobutyrivibrio sp. YE44]SDB19239.1 hypothetical protein SAMN02910298_00874 [Pseudobutyrivibrio sp. YE44]